MIVQESNHGPATTSPTPGTRRQLPAKHKAHTVQPTPTPDPAIAYRQGFMYALGGFTIMAVFVVAVVLFVLIVRFLWRGGSRPPLKGGDRA